MNNTRSTEERINILERDVRDHAKTISIIMEKLVALEQANNTRLIVEARAEERSIARTEQLERIEKEIASIKSIGVRVLWIIGTAVIGAFVTFVLRGGLTL